MAENSIGKIEQVTAELLRRGLLRQEELCAQVGIGQELFEVCLRWEIIRPSPATEEGEVLFSDESLERLCRGLRLHRDLGINWAGVCVALDLLERIEELERHLDQDTKL